MSGVLDLRFPSPVPELVEFLKLLFVDVKQLVNMDCWVGDHANIDTDRSF